MPSEFLDRDPTKVEIKVFTWLTILCGDFRMPGTYMWASTIAERIGFSVRAVELALAKLVRWGFVAIEAIEVDGKPRTMYWCTWLYNGDFSREAGAFDFGQGVMAPIDPEPKFLRPTAQIPAPRLAQEFAPQYSKELKNKTRKTTTEDAKTSSLSFCSPVGETEKGPTPPALPPPAPAPPTPLDPAIAWALDHEFPDRSDSGRSELEAKAHQWILVHKVERIINLIVELAGRRRKEPIHSLAAYGETILADWVAKGRDSMRFGKPGQGPPKTPAEKQADAAAKDQARAVAERQAREAQQRRDREDAADLARFRALPDTERRAIEDRVREAKPTIARLKNVFEPACVQAMKEAVPC